MSTTRIHPELRRIARILPRGVGRPWIVKLARRLEPRLRASRPDDVEVVSVGDGPVDLRIHRPAGHDPTTPGPALLWMHGGGYVLGTAAQDDATCRSMADRLGMVVAAVDYRLAPEHPHPTPVRDCHDALVWLAERPEVDAQRVAIGGASAGGGMAASLALLARARGEVAPAFQLLVYPMLDDRTVDGHADERWFRLWNTRSNRFGWTSYLGHEPGGDDTDPIAAPARHDDLVGLPPAWIGVGTLDLFHDEDIAYADRLAAAGVPCDLVVVEGAFHGFDNVAPKAEVTSTFFDDRDAAVRAALDPT